MPNRIEFDKLRIKLENLGSLAYSYLMAIPQKNWTSLDCIKPKFNHKTNIVAESVNSAYLQLRDDNYLSLVSGIVEREVRLLVDKREKIDVRGGLTIHAFKLIEDSRKVRDNLQLVLYENFKGTVRSRVPKKDYVVDLLSKKCSCCVYQDCLIPCAHAMYLIDSFCLNVKQFIGTLYLEENYRLSISGNINIISLSLLKLDELIQLPYIPEKRGRPSKNRLLSIGEHEEAQQERSSRKPYLCTRCGETGHNQRTCNK